MFGSKKKKNQQVVNNSFMSWSLLFFFVCRAHALVRPHVMRGEEGRGGTKREREREREREERRGDRACADGAKIKKKGKANKYRKGEVHVGPLCATHAVQ